MTTIKPRLGYHHEIADRKPTNANINKIDDVYDMAYSLKKSG